MQEKEKAKRDKKKQKKKKGKEEYEGEYEGKEGGDGYDSQTMLLPAAMTWFSISLKDSLQNASEGCESRKPHMR